MTYCDPITLPGWSLTSLGDDAKRKLSFRPMVQCWKALRRSRGQDKTLSRQSSVWTLTATLGRGGGHVDDGKRLCSPAAPLREHRLQPRHDHPRPQRSLGPLGIPPPSLASCALRTALPLDEITVPRVPPPLPVQTSRFLALPQEIRDEIYAHVFCSTRLTMGRRVTCAVSSSAGSFSSSSSTATACSYTQTGHTITRYKPARHSLALFFVCRQITHELRATDAWLGQVLFNFEDVATLLDVLGTGPLAEPKRRCKIREVRVREGGLVVRQLAAVVAAAAASAASPLSRSSAPPTAVGPTTTILLGGLLRLLPGLQLDRLTVLPALPCRVHRSTQCCQMGTATASRSSTPASHTQLAELLYAGSGWRELCYVHHDTAGLLTADRRRPGSLEAMMVNMGFWDADGDTYEAVFAEAERVTARVGSVADSESVSDDEYEDDGDDDDGEDELADDDYSDRSAQRMGLPSAPHPRLGSFLASYTRNKWYRLPRWRALLAAWDDEQRQRQPTTAVATAAEKKAPSRGRSSTRGSATSSGWQVSIDAVLVEDMQEMASASTNTTSSTVDVYGVRDGLATHALETLEDVHSSRVRGEDVMVVVRRSSAPMGSGKATRPDVAPWAEYAGNAYPFAGADPRALGWGAQWATLRPVLYPWDDVPATRSRRDRYTHRDEYVVRSPKRPASATSAAEDALQKLMGRL